MRKSLRESSSPLSACLRQQIWFRGPVIALRNQIRHIAIILKGILTVRDFGRASPGRKQWSGQKARVGLMASVEREPITGSGGDQGTKPFALLKLKAFCRWTTQIRGKICHFSLIFLKPPSKPKIVPGMDRTYELLALESFSDYCK